MSDTLSIFDDEPSEPDTSAHEPTLMNDGQRARIREFFSQLGITAAREQYALVEEITGQPIDRVDQLTEANAQLVIYNMPARIENRRASRTGNAWADRDEDTWIDRL